MKKIQYKIVKNKTKMQRNKLYHCICASCGADRGYQAKIYQNRECNICAQKDKLYNLKQRYNANNVLWDDFTIDKNSIRKFRCRCISCNKDRGYQRPNSFNVVCRSCANRVLKTGKPSPKRGIKTNIPAWNRGPYFYNKAKRVMRNRMSRRMRHALDKRLICKNKVHVFDILGYTINDLIRHLESKFQPGMSWKNYGKWHIDHIKPESLFNYSTFDDREFKQCWSLDNLQPLWAKDNLRKSNKYQDRDNYAEKRK